MQETNTSWTTLLKITRTDGFTIGLTELDEDITTCVDPEIPGSGLTFYAANGFTPTNYSKTSSLSVDNADVEGLLDVAGVDRDDIRKGLYDNALIQLFIYDWKAQEIVKMIASGYWGECTLYEGRFVAEFRSLSQNLQNTVGRLYVASCDANLGDARCMKDLTGLTFTGTVALVENKFTFYAEAFDGQETDNYWRGAIVTFDTGNNAERSFEIRTSDKEGNVSLFIPTPYDIAIGNQFTVKPGCDKSLETCKTVYNNVINFRGFPHIPGTMEILRVGKSSGNGIDPEVTDGNAPAGSVFGPFEIMEINQGSPALGENPYFICSYGPTTNYDGGRVTMVSGDASSTFFEIDNSSTVEGSIRKVVLLISAIPETIIVGDTFTITVDV